MLITLGIIGVVAALTLPTLIRNYQKQVWVTQLKKTVASIENGFALMKAEEGVDNLLDTSVFRQYNNTFLMSYANSDFNEDVRKYLNLTETKIQPELYVRSLRLSGGIFSDPWPSRCLAEGPYLPTASGSWLVLGLDIKASGCGMDEASYPYWQQKFGLGSKYSAILGSISIDVNGMKAPNQFGRDRFKFLVENSGKLIPYGSLKAGVMLSPSSGYNWKENKTMCGEVGAPIADNVTGVGCAARIIENGWVMDY